MIHLCLIGSGVMKAGVPLQQSVQGLPRETHLLWRTTSFPVSCDDMWDIINCMGGWRYWSTHTHTQPCTCKQTCVRLAQTHTLLCLRQREFWLTRIKTGCRECTHKFAHKQMQKLNSLVVNNDKLWVWLQRNPMMQCSRHVCDAPQSHVWMCDTWPPMACFC